MDAAEKRNSENRRPHRGIEAEQSKSCSGWRGPGEGLWVGELELELLRRAGEAFIIGVRTVRAGSQGTHVKLG